MAWVLAHLNDIFSVAAAAHGLAVAIVNLTPTPKDDAVVAKVYRVIELAAGIFVTSKVKM